MMRILVTGSTSLVGRHIGRTLRKTHDVFYAGRRDADFPLDLSQVQFSFPIDEHFDVIIHCAADFGGNTMEDLLRAEMTNAIGTLNVVRIGRQVEAAHVILISTCFAASSPLDHYYNAYSLSKRHGEELAAFACGKTGLPLTILRPVQIYGDHVGYEKHQPLLYHLINQAARGEDILLYGQQDPERNFIHVDDFAAVVQGVLEKNIAGLHAVASNRSYKISEIAKLAYAAFQTQGRVHFDTTRSDIPQLEPVNHSPLLASLGLTPKIDLADGLRRLSETREGR